MPYVVSRCAAAWGEVMGVFGLRQFWVLVCLLLCLADLTSCAVLKGQRSWPSGPKRSSGQDAGVTLFNDAEQAYRQRDYARARHLYHAFLTNYPQSSFIDDASFRLAEILYYEGTYTAALQALQDYLTKFPRGKLASDTAYFQGLSLLHLKRYHEAREVLGGAPAGEVTSQTPG